MSWRVPPFTGDPSPRAVDRETTRDTRLLVERIRVPDRRRSAWIPRRWRGPPRWPRGRADRGDHAGPGGFDVRQNLPRAPVPPLSESVERLRRRNPFERRRTRHREIQQIREFEPSAALGDSTPDLRAIRRCGRCTGLPRRPGALRVQGGTGVVVERVTFEQRRTGLKLRTINHWGSDLRGIRPDARGLFGAP